jgi:hypothetical protein
MVQIFTNLSSAVSVYVEFTSAFVVKLPATYRRIISPSLAPWLQVYHLVSKEEW